MRIDTPHEVIVQVLGNTFGTGDEYAVDILDALGSAGYVIVSAESLPPTEQRMPSLPERMRAAAVVLSEVNDRHRYGTIETYGRRDLLALADRWEREDAKKANMFANVNDVGELINQAVGAGSMCWENVRAAGGFDSAEAVRVASDVCARLKEILLGNAGMKDEL